MLRADNLTTFMFRLSRNPRNPKGLSRPVMGLLYLYLEVILYFYYWYIIWSWEQMEVLH